jgi:hypothetical protein
MELLARSDSGKCIITGLDTNFKYNGNWIYVGFLTAANKLCEKYPETNFNDAVDIVLSAQVYRATKGEDKMDIESVREDGTYKKKLKDFLGIK